MTGIGGWQLERARGAAAAFHARPVPTAPVRAVWWFEVDGPTVVLGSSQPDDAVDADGLAATGAQLARRRSGGGAVWLAPGEVTWVDVVLPADDPLWVPDVRRAGEWLGEAWVAALERVGLAGGTVHRGGLVERPWSELVCFAGLGPGEVTLGGAKVVGVSQRRTRQAARFQCAVVHRWDVGALLACLALAPGDRRRAAIELAEAVQPVAADPDEVVAALLAELPR
jgi:lipoate-protein ligase A